MFYQEDTPGMKYSKLFAATTIAMLSFSVLAQSVPSALSSNAPDSAPTPRPLATPTAVATPVTGGIGTLGAEAPSRIYIAVGDPNVKKVLLAVESTTGDGNVAQEFFQTMNTNMDFTDLFELLPLARMPEKRGDLNAYKVLGVEFLLRSSVVSTGGRYEAEVRLFDVTRGVQVLGRRYPLVSQSGQPGRELAHYSANDIVQSLTGEPGIFRTRILMSCGRKTKDIYIMDFDGQNLRQITKDGNLALSPSWAPDGKRILFTSYKPAVKGAFINPNLYMVDLMTNQRKLIAAAKGLNTGGVFHPRLNKLAYTYSQNGRPEIYTLDLSNNTRMPVTKSDFFTVEPAWSPDGSQLAFSSFGYSGRDSPRPHIYIANADGSGRKRLTIAGQYNSSPNWSPKGDKIVFSGQENRKNNFNIFYVNPGTGEIQRLTDGSDSKENPAFSPDGRFLVYSGNAGGQYRVYVMTSMGTRIRALSPPSLGHCKQATWSPRL
jgi:TolB protein